jgi:hypothetical protein
VCQWYAFYAESCTPPPGWTDKNDESKWAAGNRDFDKAWQAMVKVSVR